jgi:dUTPase
MEMFAAGGRTSLSPQTPVTPGRVVVAQSRNRSRTNCNERYWPILWTCTPPQAYLHPGSNPSEHSNLWVHIPIRKYLVVPAHQTVLGATLEFIKLPFDVSGQILTKSSVARTFVVIETAPWIHPNYRGCLTLEIANVSNTPVLLYPGLPIAQRVLIKVEAAVPASVLTGTYFGPIYPKPPPPKNLKRHFGRIGIDNPVIPVLHK